MTRPVASRGCDARLGYPNGFDRLVPVRQSEGVAVFSVIYVILFIFWLLLIGRIIVEFIRVFAREWRPTGFVVVVLETIFTITDPPVKLLRRLIPPISLGGVRLDLSIMVLLFLLFILMQVVAGLASPAGFV